MTKHAFLRAYRKELLAVHTWAHQPTKLDNFMQSVRDTIFGERIVWNIDGPSTLAAWRAIGCEGKPTYKALRALPAGEE